MSKLKTRALSPRPPFTGPSQVVTLELDEMQTPLWVYVRGITMDIATMHDRVLAVGPLNVHSHPALHAVLMLLKDDKYADPRFKAILAYLRDTETPNHRGLSPSPAYYRIPMKLGEIAAAEPELAEKIRKGLKAHLFGESYEGSE